MTAPAPDRPTVGVLAVVRRGGRVLIVKRSQPASGGRWGFPGGHLERGETIVEGAMRELTEETGVRAEPVETLPPLQFIRRDDRGAVQFHYVLIPVIADWRAGDGAAADDAAALRWVGLDEIAARVLPMFDDVEQVARIALSPPGDGDQPRPKRGGP